MTKGELFPRYPRNNVANVVYSQLLVSLHALENSRCAMFGRGSTAPRPIVNADDPRIFAKFFWQNAQNGGHIPIEDA